MSSALSFKAQVRFNGLYLKAYTRLALILIVLTNFCSAQNTIVRGTIFDKVTNEVIAFAPVIFQNTTIGTVTDFNGDYTLSSSVATDSIVISNIGYKKSTVFIKKNSTQKINIALDPENYNLNEILIKPGRNPAFRILDNLIEHKNENKGNSQANYEREEYEKFKIYYSNYSKKFTERKQFKNFKFMFDYADSSKNGKPQLPIFMSEIIKIKFISHLPELNKEIEIANKSTGETYENLTSIANHLVENINVYDNYYSILDKSFISPINDNYKLFYKYYLVDSLILDNKKSFKIRFESKWKEDFTFSGEMNVQDSTWAITKINLFTNPEINLNYVKYFEVKQEFEQVNNKWTQKKLETYALISIVKGKQSDEFRIDRSTSYKYLASNDPDKIHFDYLALTKSTEDDATLKSEEYWNAARHDSLTVKEKYNYFIADTLNYVPLVKKIKNIFIMVASGFVEVGKIRIGQIHTFYSFNPIELDRYKLGFKTNKHFSKKIQFEAYGAYGSSDKLVKYKGSILYVPIKDHNRLSMGLSYKNDLDQLGVSTNQIQFDNILTSLTKTSEINRLTFNKEAIVFIEKYWTNGFSNNLSFSTKEIQPLGDLSFEKLIDTAAFVRQIFNTISTTEVHLNTRISFQEKHITTEFKRKSRRTLYPIINLDITLGIKGLLNAQYDYQKIKLNIKGKRQLNPIGYTQYNLEVGKIFGNAPYILAEMHPGNQTLIYDEQAFNLMKYFEFVSDEYIHLHLDHHFEGFFFNKLPLIKKAELREVVSARGVVGNLHNSVKSEMILPTGMSDVSKPYVECSVGVENIFKVIRIDYIWRVTDKSLIPSENWSIKAKLYLSF